MKKKNGDIKKILSKDDKIHFIKRLYELIKHGYMLEESIEFLMLQYGAASETIIYIKEQMSTGKKLSYILEELGYSVTVVSKMQFAEQYGQIESMLLEIDKYLTIKKEQQEKIVKAIRYPLFLTVTLLALIMVFNTLVIPQFESIYSTSNLPMDKQVIILISILYYLPKILIVILFIIIAISIYTYYLYKYKPAQFIKQILKIPFIHTYFKYYFSYQYTGELSLFLKSGFSIKLALDELVTKNFNKYFKIFSEDISNKLSVGIPFEEATKNLVYFDNSMYKFIMHGRRNNMLAKELQLYSEIMLDSFIKLIDKRLKKIQPILFFLLALIIIGLYLVILLPIFNMTSAIK